MFAPELNDEEQNLIGFLLGAALKACDRPGGYKELHQIGFNKNHIVRMLQKFGHDTDKLSKEIIAKKRMTKEMCICGHEKNDHFYNMYANRYNNCMMCMMCNEYLSPGGI